MKNANESITASLERIAQLEHRVRQKAYAEQNREKKLHNVLVFKIGEIALKCWPCLALLRVRRTKAENETELAQLREFLLHVAASEQYSIFRANITSREEMLEE